MLCGLAARGRRVSKLDSTFARLAAAHATRRSKRGPLQASELAEVDAAREAGLALRRRAARVVRASLKSRRRVVLDKLDKLVRAARARLAHPGEISSAEVKPTGLISQRSSDWTIQFPQPLRGADVKYAELKEKAAKGEPLPGFALKNVRISFNLDASYQTVHTQYTRNVVGIIEGSDPKLKDTYVAFGAHYDHVGYFEGEANQGANAPRSLRAPGPVTPGATADRVWNGADDDGSGTVTIMGVAKAFATGPKPRRSLVFVWHSGEEKGLLGSRYFADYPTVPMDKVIAQVNMDMVGRNRDDKAEEASTVYIVGSDRISTEFHNITVDANGPLAKPLKLDYEMNDPTDLEQIYYRSDHYSYAAKGVPIVFLTTGLHPDYHHNTDSVEKINFEKMARIGQYAYEIGVRTANMDHAPARDNRGPRVGRTVSGKLKL
ncbi:MAG: hypothetical protein DMF60_08690 [Acidobacteria bacterium]|nr:MAG: hypothetical protein DMF60_08690 [Acidobacteriota bacterium]